MEIRRLKFFIPREWMNVRMSFPEKYHNMLYAKSEILWICDLNASTR